MKIQNIRLGFATNSSSTHSVIIAKGLSDHEHQEGLSYQWENFILASTKAKRRYLFTAAVVHFRRTMGLEESVILANSVFPVSKKDQAAAIEDACAIDHQSIPVFPRPRIPTNSLLPLLRLLDREISLSDKVAITGGSDNDDREWLPRDAQGVPLLAIWEDIIEREGSNDRVFTIDPSSHHISIFDQRTGRKIRIVLEGFNPPTRSTVPELIDIKITNYCSAGCPYCYQDSSTTGTHASADDLNTFAREAGRLGVFEVAIGGGEPTSHPQFINILREFRENGIVPNFSTQQIDWLNNSEIVKAVKKYCGGVALSTQDPDRANAFLRECYKKEIRSSIHYVLGITPLSNLEKMLKSDSHDSWTTRNIVLLAYKQMGRATNTPPKNYAGWENIVRKWGLQKEWNVAVDSFLVRDVEDNFSREEIPAHLFENGDGKFSLYFDAVEGTYAAHSFMPLEKRLSYPSYPWLHLEEAWNSVETD